MEDVGLPLPWGIIPAERVRRVVPVPSPAAGAEWSVSVPGGVLWVVRAVKGRLTTSAVVANRRPDLKVSDGSIDLFGIGALTNQAANFVDDWSWVAGYASNVGGFSPGDETNYFPEFPLYGGYIIRTVTRNIDAGDQWSAIVVTVDEYEVRGLERAWERYVDAVQAAVDAYAETIERQARRFTEALERGAHV